MSIATLGLLQDLQLPQTPVPAPTRSAAPPVKVLHLINGEHFAGAERVQDLLALRLPEFGYAVNFVALKRGEFAERKTSTAPVSELAMRNGWDLRPALQLRKWVQEQGIELLHSHTVRSALIARTLATLTGLPWVHHLHSPTLRDTDQSTRNRWNAWLEKICLSTADRILCVSESLRAYAATAGFPVHRISVVRNGVPDQGPLTTRPSPAGVWKLGMVALFRPRKGLEVLLQALAELRSEGHALHLTALGKFESPEYEQSIQKLVQQYQLQSHITWKGFVTGIPAELKQLDALVLPSLYGEGLPMVILEAMAAGLPVVATRVEGVTEALQDGIDGLIAEPQSASDLAAKLRELFTGRHDWQTLRTNAYRRFVLEFSDQAMAAGVADAYRQVLAQRSANTQSPSRQLR